MHAADLGAASIYELCDESMRHRRRSIEIVDNASHKYFLTGFLLEVLQSLETAVSTHYPQLTHELHYDQ